MTKYAYFNGSICPISNAKVSIMTHTFNYGTGCFGGLRGYWNAESDTLYLFRLRDHYDRFMQSAKILLADITYSASDLCNITVELLAKENWRQDCYIRPLLYKSDEKIGVRLHSLTDAIAIFSVPMGSYLPNEEGVSVCTSSWRRVDDTAIPPRGKLIGSYMNSALIKSEAQLNGFDDAIVLNQDGHVSEGSAANLIIIRDEELITPPVEANALDGITLRSLLHVAQHDMGLTVHRRPIDRTELYIADEAFFCGTGAQVAAIVSVDHRPVGNGAMGSLTRQIRDYYFQIVRGNVSTYSHWLTPVPKLHPEVFADTLAHAV